METWTEERRRDYALRLAYERGLAGGTFATYDEHTTPGYGEAWSAGRAAAEGR
jgi:hypothetical protein